MNLENECKKYHPFAIPDESNLVTNGRCSFPPTIDTLCGYPWDRYPFSTSTGKIRLQCSSAKRKDECLQSFYNVQCIWIPEHICGWKHDVCNSFHPSLSKNGYRNSVCYDQKSKSTCEKTIEFDEYCKAQLFSNEGMYDINVNEIFQESSSCVNRTRRGDCDAGPLIFDSCAWYEQEQFHEFSPLDFMACCRIPSLWCEMIGLNYTLENVHKFVGSSMCEAFVGPRSSIDRIDAGSGTKVIDESCCSNLSKSNNVPTDRPNHHIFVSSNPSNLPTKLHRDHIAIGPPSTPNSSLSPTLKASYSPISLEETNERPDQSIIPSLMKSEKPSFERSKSKSKLPSMQPSKKPSFDPTNAVPSILPNILYSYIPSHKLGNAPSMLPSFPSMSRSIKSSEKPSFLLTTREPSVFPTIDVSEKPSLEESHIPSMSPSIKSSEKPSFLVTREPSVFPTIDVSEKPSLEESHIPSMSPSIKSSEQPSFLLTREPSVFPKINDSEKPSLEETRKTVKIDARKANEDGVILSSVMIPILVMGGMGFCFAIRRKFRKQNISTPIDVADPSQFKHVPPPIIDVADPSKSKYVALPIRVNVEIQDSVSNINSAKLRRHLETMNDLTEVNPCDPSTFA